MQPKSIEKMIRVYLGDMKAGRPSKSPRTDFARRLSELREAAGLSQREVARRLDIAQSSYANWERYNVALKPEQLTALVGILGVSIEDLLGAENNRRKSGPPSKLERQIEAVSRLPRSKQKFVSELLDNVLGESAG